jgi:hypothetical protein
VTQIGFEDLAAGLRGWVRGGTAHEQAAVELLIWHETWLRRPDFKGACMTQLAAGLVARIDWYEAREFIDRGYSQRGQQRPVPASSSQRRVLDLVVALGEDQFGLSGLGTRISAPWRRRSRRLPACGSSRRVPRPTTTSRTSSRATRRPVRRVPWRPGMTAACCRLPGRRLRMTTPRRDYGPRQLADYLGAFYGQVDRARDFGLLPEPDRGGRRWSAAAAGEIRGRWPEIAAAVECIGAPGLKARGWTEAMIRELLGAPDVLTDNPHYKSAAPRRLWRLQKVQAAEGTPGFAERRDAAAAHPAARAALQRRIWKALGGT